jgi:hypothetical protein
MVKVVKKSIATIISIQRREYELKFLSFSSISLYLFFFSFLTNIEVTLFFLCLLLSGDLE